MRRALPLLLLPSLLCLSACDPQTRFALTALDIGVVPVFGRTLPDLLVSAGTGRDCSMVRVEQGKTYCRDAEPPPVPEQFCTRSLGTVDCWTSRDDQPWPPRRGVADGARDLTAAQEADRLRGWPGLSRPQYPARPVAIGGP